MSKDGLTQVKYALMFGRLRYGVIPLCWPSSTGYCGCGWNHKVDEVGKAPRVRKGVKAASSEAPKIERLSADIPDANIGISLDGLVMIDPDSDEAQIEAEELGIPPTLKRISRFDAYIFRAPEGLPSARLIHRGESGAIDVLAGGYMVAHGVHRTGCEVTLQDLDIDPADAPQWALDWINDWAEAKVMDSTRTEAEGAPPVRLRATAMKWWNGTNSKDGPNDVDRSTTLYRIALFLASANASATVIAEAIAERDVTLGYHKYSDRSDGPTRYLEIAHKAIAAQPMPYEPRNSRETSHNFRPLPAFTVTVLP